MQGQKVLFVGGQGPVSAPALRLLAPDNDVFASTTDLLRSVGTFL